MIITTVWPCSQCGGRFPSSESFEAHPCRKDLPPVPRPPRVGPLKIWEEGEENPNVCPHIPLRAAEEQP